ncbi:MAG: helix-hairpin-helix domain-containing protein [Deltaproteobacteria bacterium]|nr:MAG: helix-hairpin-helix domain-containing protein [Deltaproteobacteria bacterium]
MHIPVLFALLAGAATAATPALPSAAAASARIPREKKPPKAKMAGVVNVNRASEAELRLLPGIGRGRAHAIVERRAKRPFSSLDELARMKRMKTVVQKNRTHLSVEGETTLRPAGP